MKGRHIRFNVETEIEMQPIVIDWAKKKQRWRK